MVPSRAKHHNLDCKVTFIFDSHLWFQKQPPEVFCKKDVLRNFAKLTGKHLYQILFFNKFAGLPATLLKKRLYERCFPVYFAKFLITPFLKNTSQWLLLWFRLWWYNTCLSDELNIYLKTRKILLSWKRHCR